MSNIHNTAVIEGDVEIGEGTTIGAHCYIKGPAKIGKNTIIRPGTVIGTDAENREHGSKGTIFIGDDTMISDLVTVQRGTGDRDTEIGDRCFIMAHNHVGHDVKIEDDVTIAPGVVLGGHVLIQKGATLGMGVMVHQFAIIGGYCMLGMNATVTKNIRPFSLSLGMPARPMGNNEYRIKKLNIDNLEDSEIYKEAMRLFEEAIAYREREA